MTILTRRSAPNHWVAFGTTEAADRFLATSEDPANWTLDDLQATVTD